MTLDVLEAFLADHQERCNERRIEPIDDGLLRPALEGFVLDKPWWERDGIRKLGVARYPLSALQSGRGAPPQDFSAR